MARISLTSAFTLIPEGEYVFGIYDVNYDEDFGRMEVKMVTAEGLRHTERFSLKDSNDEVNEKAMNAFSIFAKTAMNRYDLEDIDHTDLIGHYIRARVTHTTLPSRKDPTKTTTFVNLDRDKTSADGFDTQPSQSALNLMASGAAKKEAPVANVPQTAQEAPVSASTMDLDALLG